MFKSQPGSTTINNSLISFFIKNYHNYFMEKVTILGSGTWGSALAMHLARNKKNVTLYSRFEEEVNGLAKNLTHPNLPKAVFPSCITFTSNLKEALSGANIVVIATPSPFVRETAKNAAPYLEKDAIIVCVAKGIEAGTLYTMSEIITDEVGLDFPVVALSGPSHAEEVSLGMPTTIVSACKDINVAKKVQEIFNSDYFRVYTNTDIKGVEIAGATKNIIAIACGISEGLGFGDNAVAAIITRGLAEITRLGQALDCSFTTFFGLSGVGDIVVTATSVHSRNHKAGNLLGKGHKLEDVKKEVGMVIEGINCLEAAKELAQKVHVEMPIVDGMYDLIFGGKSPMEVVSTLFNRELKSE